jgi:hypothetical protein
MKRDVRSAFAKSELDRSVAAWRAVERSEQLSPEARARILDSAARTSVPAPALRPLVTLFFPTWRWAWAGVAPVALLTVALAVLAIPHRVGSATVRVEARKVSGEVEFLIANGGTPHRVSKRSIPYRAGDGKAIATRNGSFRDALDSDEPIVFYRID